MSLVCDDVMSIVFCVFLKLAKWAMDSNWIEAASKSLIENRKRGIMSPVVMT